MFSEQGAIRRAAGSEQETALRASVQGCRARDPAEEGAEAGLRGVPRRHQRQLRWEKPGSSGGQRLGGVGRRKGAGYRLGMARTQAFIGEKRELLAHSMAIEADKRPSLMEV